MIEGHLNRDLHEGDCISAEERAQQREQQTQVPKAGTHLVPEGTVPSSRTTDKL